MGEDCDALLQELHDYLHGELDATEAHRLRQHLEACPPCLETADFQAELRRLVAQRCCEEVPSDLRSRVVAMLQVEVSGRDRAPGEASP